MKRASPFTMAAVGALLAGRARAEIAQSRLEAQRRPVGETRIDVDFASKADRDKPLNDYDFEAHGRRYQGFGARWAVWLVRWTGDEWRHVRRLTCPLQFSEALTRATELCTKRRLERVQ